MKEKASKLFLLTIVLVLYGLTLRGIYGNPDAKYILANLESAATPFELSPERGRYALILAITEGKSFELKDDIAKIALPDLGYYNGHFYSIFPPGVSFIVLPAYLIGKSINLAQVAVFAVPAIFATLNGIFIFLILKKLGVKSHFGILAGLIFCFATTSWSYAVTLYQHHITTFLILSGFYAVLRFRQKTKYSWVWAFIVWINYAVGFVVDSPNAFLLLPVMVYFFFSCFQIDSKAESLRIIFRPVILYTIIGFIFIISFYSYYNQINYGNWTQVRKNLIRITSIQNNELISDENLSISPSKSTLSLFNAANIYRGLYTLFISPDRGITYYSPVLLLGLLGILALYKKSPTKTLVLLGIISGNIFIYSAFGDPWGGWAYGPRYLIPSMAILSIFLGCAYNSIRSIWFKLISIPFILFSVAVALLGALTTNQIPPQSEAIPLGIGYNYLYNLKFLFENKSSSFLYNQIFHSYLSLLQYAVILYSAIVVIILILLFIQPQTEERQNV